MTNPEPRQVKEPRQDRNKYYELRAVTQEVNILCDTKQYDGQCP